MGRPKLPRKPCKRCGLPIRLHFRGIFCSRICASIWLKEHYPQKLREKHRQLKLGRKNPMWKGRMVGLSTLHTWVKRRLKKPFRCERCKKIKKLDLANISQRYFRKLDDWEWLCRKCHMTKDGRIEGLIKRIKQDSEKNKRLLICPICKKEERVPPRFRKITCSRSCGGKLVKHEQKIGLRPPPKKRKFVNFDKKTGRFVPASKGVKYKIRRKWWKKSKVLSERPREPKSRRREDKMPILGSGWQPSCLMRWCVVCLRETTHDARMENDWLVIRCCHCGRESALYRVREPTATGGQPK